MSDSKTTLFHTISTLKVGVIGDFAVDLYYQLEKATGEISLETGHTVYRGAQPRSALGAAGNVVKNLRALGVSEIWTFGLVGDDIWGRELLHLLQQQQVITDHMLVQTAAWEGCAYLKPMEGKKEEHRLDFGSYNQADPKLKRVLLDKLKMLLPQLQVLIMNQQFVSPLLDEEMVKALNQLAEEHPHCMFVADLRQLGHLLEGITVKANAQETARILGIPAFDASDTQECQQQAQALSQKLKSPVLLTRGENGMMYFQQGTLHHVPGILLDGEIDPVGAGDTAISTFSVCLAAGATPPQALEWANLAAAVTVKKLYQTGTASLQEMEAQKQSTYHLYHVHKANHPEAAVYYQQSQIEIIEPFARKKSLRFVVMDHDGTISVLREGWDDLMHDMMLECISGTALTVLDSETYQMLSSKVKQLISQTTGAPTLVQMEGLVTLIGREGMIPSDTIETAEYYKEKFVHLLNQHIEERKNRIQQGELSRDDFTIKGVISFLEEVSQRNLTLYLVSGTDEDYVQQEAEALGYAHLFKGGIHGARPNGISAKRKVLDYLTLDQQVSGEEILVMGDGPSEIREGRRAGALCVGIASDEVRRFGLNLHKRNRLIRAGAHLVIPDFSQSARLATMLFDQNAF